MSTRLTFLGWIFAAPAMAASLVLSNNPATGGPGKFAAEEIRREAVAQGMTLGEDAKATRVTVTVGKAGDAAGAMYGGLDVAEAIRTGALDTLKDSDHTPQLQ